MEAQADGLGRSVTLGPDTSGRPDTSTEHLQKKNSMPLPGRLDKTETSATGPGGTSNMFIRKGRGGSDPSTPSTCDSRDTPAGAA